MEQKLLIQLVELCYILNDMNKPNRAVVKMNSKRIAIVVYQNVFEDIDLTDTYAVYFGKKDTKERFKHAISEINYYINSNKRTDE